MTQAIAKYAAKKMLSSEMNKYKSKEAAGPYDPYYELIPHPKNPNKKKKVKRQIPAYIPSHDADILAKARKRAYRLDYCLFNFMGLRFGWSSVIGIVPAIGDACDMMLALMLVRSMKKAEGGLPASVQMTMLLNIVIDFVIGLVPFVGDLADAYVKCNSKNVRAFEKYLDKVHKPKNRRSQMEEDLLRQGYHPTPATEYEDFSDEDEDRRTAFTDQHDAPIRQPQRAYSGRRERQPDEEMGYSRQDTQRSHRSTREEPGRKKSGRRH